MNKATVMMPWLPILTDVELKQALAEKRPEIQIDNPDLAQETAARIATERRRRRRKIVLWTMVAFLPVLIGILFLISLHVGLWRVETAAAGPPHADSATLDLTDLIVPVIYIAGPLIALWLILRFITSIVDRGFDDIAIKYSTKQFGSGQLILKRRRN